MEMSSRKKDKTGVCVRDNKVTCSEHHIVSSTFLFSTDLEKKSCLHMEYSVCWKCFACSVIVRV